MRLLPSLGALGRRTLVVLKTSKKVLVVGILVLGFNLELDTISLEVDNVSLITYNMRVQMTQ